MTDRFHRIRALSFAAVGLSVAFGGCSRSEQQAETPATTLAQHAEPPRLFPEGAFEATMDAPLTLDRASMPPQTDRNQPSPRVPDADEGLFGEAQDWSADAQIDNNSDNLTLPPSDRTVAIETADDEAPLPELLPFETSQALAEHAATPPTDIASEAVEPIEEEQTKSDPSDIAEAPVADSPEVAEPAEVPATPDSAAVAETASEPAAAATDVVESAPSAPLVSTGALSINNIKSVGAADRQVVRLEVPGGGAASNNVAPTTPVPAMPNEIASTPGRPASVPPEIKEPSAVAPALAAPAPETVAQQAVPQQPVNIPAPVEKPSRSIAEAPQPSAPRLVVSAPPASHEAAAVTPSVAPLKAQASPNEVAAGRRIQSPLDVTTPSVRPTAPSFPTTKSTTTAPPTSVAIEQPTDANHRAPLPAQAIPPQPALLAKSELEPSGQAAIRLMPSTVSSKPQHTQARVAVDAAPQRVQASPANPARPVAEPFVSRDRALPAADLAPPTRSAEMIAVARLADEHTRLAFDLAGRRAMYSARNEFIEALQIMAHAIDAEQHTLEHSQALADGLTAIRESDDFASHGGRLQDNIDVIRLAKPHTTPVLKGLQPNSVSRLAAMQQYYTYAQRRLAFSVGREPSGSLALYGLGKLHSVLSQQPAQGIASAEPKAIIFHQAALLVDGRNYMAANDLGVLLARYGKYPQAKAALLHSLEVSPQPATWHNLTVVHQQLGEVRLAQLAHAESRAATQKVKQLARANGQSVTDNATVVWLDPATFSRSSEMWSPPTPNGQPEQAPNATPKTASKPANTPPAAASKRGFFRK